VDLEKHFTEIVGLSVPLILANVQYRTAHTKLDADASLRTMFVGRKDISNLSVV